MRLIIQLIGAKITLKWQFLAIESLQTWFYTPRSSSISESRAHNTTFVTKNKTLWPCVADLRLILGQHLPWKCQEKVIWSNFLAWQHQNSIFLFFTDSRQSQLHFGTKIMYILVCVADLRLKLSRNNCKNGFQGFLAKNDPKWAPEKDVKVVGDV